jgi:dolichyl-phosphate-mannose--protein O-mannosyl transferase
LKAAMTTGRGPSAADEARLVAPWASTGAAPRLLSRMDNIRWCMALGLACGTAVSVKWTGLATPGMVALDAWLAIFFLPEAVHFADMLIMLATAFVFYASNYFVHFSLLPLAGDGDAFMRLEFQKTLVNNSNYDPNAPVQPFWKSFWELAWEMLSGNARIEQRHAWESVWHSWPLNKRGVLYYSNTTDPIFGYTESVYLVGNPVVIWGVTAALVATAVYIFLYYRYRSLPALRAAVFDDADMRRRFLPVVAYCTIAYVANLAPYMAVTRSCFIYHYMPALLYAELLAGVAIEKMAGRWIPHVAKYLLMAILVVYVFYMPWIYALPLSAEGHQRRRWLPSWD